MYPHPHPANYNVWQLTWSWWFSSGHRCTGRLPPHAARTVPLIHPHLTLALMSHLIYCLSQFRQFRVLEWIRSGWGGLMRARAGFVIRAVRSGSQALLLWSWCTELRGLQFEVLEVRAQSLDLMILEAETVTMTTARCPPPAVGKWE